MAKKKKAASNSTSNGHASEFVAPPGGLRVGGKTYRSGNPIPERYGHQLKASARAADPADGVRGTPPNFGRDLLPHIITFQGRSVAPNNIYRIPDEAVKDSLENARIMRTDLSIMECLEARQRATALLNWHLEPEDAKNPKQKALADDLTKIIKRTPFFTEYRRNLLEALWYGRYAVQHAYDFKVIGGQRRVVVKNWLPINGDKLAFRFDEGSGRYKDGQVGIKVGGGWNVGDVVAGDRKLEATDYGLAYFLEDWERTRLALHRHMVEDGAYEDPMTAGRIFGVGIRDRLYWTWFQKQHTMAQLMELVERTGAGFTIYYYPAGNAKARAELEELVKNQRNDNAILFPRNPGDPSMDAYGIDQIPANVAGIKMIQELLQEFFGHQIKRYILGQILSSESAATGLGSGVADLHLETLLQIVAYDAGNLEETLTTDLVEPLKLFNFPSARDVYVRFKIDTESSEVEKKLGAFRQAWEMGCRIKAADVMDTIGAAMPTEEDEVLQNPAMQQQQRLWEQTHDGAGAQEEGSVADLFGPLVDDGQGGGDDEGGDLAELDGGGPDGGPDEAGGEDDGPEQYAKKLKSSPGQGSFNWDEEKHPRDEDGKFASAGEAAKAGKSHAEWAGAASDAFVAGHIDEDHPAWRAIQHGTAPTIREFNDARDLFGQHVKTWRGEFGQVTDIEDDGKSVVVTHADGSTSKHYASGLSHLGAEIEHRTGKGKDNENAIAYLAPKLAEESLASGDNLSVAMKAHGIDPTNLAVRKAAGESLAKLQEEAKPNPSEARQRAMDRSAERNSIEPKEPPSSEGTANPPVIQTPTRKIVVEDFGEKIGGARKDTARPIGKRGSKATEPADSRPAWARRYEIGQIAKSMKPGEEGKWTISDKLDTNWAGTPRQKGGLFNSKEEAEAAVPLIAVSRNHRVYRERNDADGKATYGIFRNITDRKRALVKGGFASEEEAMKHMAANPHEVIEHKFPDWEDYSYLESVERTGKEHHKGDVSSTDFQRAFGFRGGEFGKWQMNKDGQTSLNHAFNALHDLADVLGLPPKAMSLNGELGIGFGSRGTGGKHAGKAHYEPGSRAVINMTKMKGAGSLAHEWFHALDNYMGKQAHGNPESDHLLTNGVPYKNSASPEATAAWKHLVEVMHYKPETKAIVAPNAEKIMAKQRDRVASRVREIENSLSYEASRGKRFKPFTPAEQKEWDELKARVIAGDVGEEKWVHPEGTVNNPRGASRRVFEPVEAMNKLFKKATGRFFHKGHEGSTGHYLNADLHHLLSLDAQRLAADAGQTETRRVHTDFSREAQKLDNYRTGDYYTKPHEMAARAFAAYVQDKIEGQGNQSQYLTAKSHNKHYALIGAKPFPEGEERAAVNAAFDRLFAALKHESRTDEKGDHVRLYERDGQPERYDKALRDSIRDAADETDREPSDAQRESGNYRKGKVQLHGLTITIENPKGSRRRPEWKPLKSHYGYINRTNGRDGDHVDVFLGPKPESEVVFVVDQCSKGGRFDEHKAMIGWASEEEARAAYLSNYDSGWKCGPITAMTVDQFREWLDRGDTTKAVAKQVSRYAATPPAATHRPGETMVKNGVTYRFNENSRWELADEEEGGDGKPAAGGPGSTNAAGPPLKARQQFAAKALKSIDKAPAGLIAAFHASPEFKAGGEKWEKDIAGGTGKKVYAWLQQNVGQEAGGGQVVDLGEGRLGFSSPAGALMLQQGENGKWAASYTVMTGPVARAMGEGQQNDQGSNKGGKKPPQAAAPDEKIRPVKPPVVAAPAKPAGSPKPPPAPGGTSNDQRPGAPPLPSEAGSPPKSAPPVPPPAPGVAPHVQARDRAAAAKSRLDESVALWEQETQKGTLSAKDHAKFRSHIAALRSQWRNAEDLARDSERTVKGEAKAAAKEAGKAKPPVAAKPAAAPPAAPAAKPSAPVAKPLQQPPANKPADDIGTPAAVSPKAAKPDWKSDFASHLEGAGISPSDANREAVQAAVEKGWIKDLGQLRRVLATAKKIHERGDVTQDDHDSLQRAISRKRNRKETESWNKIAAEAASAWEMTPERFNEVVEGVWKDKQRHLVERENAKAAARKATGLTAADINRLENQGFDSGSDHPKLKGLDSVGRSLASTYPELGWGRGYVQGEAGDVDDIDYGEQLWNLLREGKQPRIAKTDPKFMEAVEEYLASQHRPVESTLSPERQRELEATPFRKSGKAKRYGKEWDEGKHPRDDEGEFVDNDKGEESDDDAADSKSRVVKFSGDEFDLDMPNRDMREQVMKFARKNLIGRSFKNESTGKDIKVPVGAIKKATTDGRKKVRILAIAKLPELLQHAVYDSSKLPSKSPESNVKMYHYFTVNIKVGDSPYTGRLVVREDNNGDWFYSHEYGSP